MKYNVIPVTPLQQNCTLISCEETGKAAVVDPGGELDRIIAAAEEVGVEIEKILLTHAHVDHAGGAGELSRRLKLPIEGPHKEDRFWIQALNKARPSVFPPLKPLNQSDGWSRATRSSSETAGWRCAIARATHRDT